jgi:hypothetical protein
MRVLIRASDQAGPKANTGHPWAGSVEDQQIDASETGAPIALQVHSVVRAFAAGARQL